MILFKKYPKIQNLKLFGTKDIETDSEENDELSEEDTYN
jgi:hypothetical protein